MGAAFWQESVVQDIRYSLRGLVKNPGFSVATILTLALAIGASTAIFSIVDAVLLRALPYPNPDRIVSIWEKTASGHRANVSDPDFDDFQTQNKTLEALAIYSGNQLASVTGGTEPVRLNVSAVSPDFFRVLGVQPILGHIFEKPNTAVISFSYWQKYFAATSDLSQLHLRIDGDVYPVAGVMPPAFDFPAEASIWIPSDVFPKSSSRTAHNWHCLGRLKRGITISQARANLSIIAHRIRNEYGNKADLTDAPVAPLLDDIVGDVRTDLLTLLAAAGLLLLVACANVAGLFIARASARRKELAVRIALGATRSRRLQQLLIESSLLSSAGGVLGVLVAFWAVAAFRTVLPPDLPRQQGISIDLSALSFAIAVSFAVALALGLFAAWRDSEQDTQRALVATSRSVTGSKSSQRTRALVVIGEMAMTLVILVGAGLLAHSFWRLLLTSPGFTQQNLITMEFSLPNPPTQTLALDDAAVASQVRLIDDLLNRLRALPGVESASVTGALPVAAGDNLASGTFLLLNGQKPPANFDEWGRIAQDASQTDNALYAVSDGEYFRTTGLPLIRGRVFRPPRYGKISPCCRHQPISRPRALAQSESHRPDNPLRKHGWQPQTPHHRRHRRRRSRPRLRHSAESHDLRQLSSARHQHELFARHSSAQRRTLRHG